MIMMMIMMIVVVIVAVVVVLVVVMVVVVAVVAVVVVLPVQIEDDKYFGIYSRSGLTGAEYTLRTHKHVLLVSN